MRWLEKEVESRAQAEQLMRESQACFVTIFRSSPMGIIRARGKIEGVELEFRKKSGEMGTMLGSAELIDLSDEPHLLTMMLDITDRKRAEEACEESEGFYHHNAWIHPGGHDPGHQEDCFFGHGDGCKDREGAFSGRISETTHEYFFTSSNPL
jgi:PAS domain-containing protein